jgi:hypothetical protein
MFEKGIGNGVRSNRCGTWSLVALLALFALPVFGSSALMWVPLWTSGATTAGAVGFGIAGLFNREQRRPALYGLLKATPTLVVAGLFVLLLVVLSSMSFE